MAKESMKAREVKRAKLVAKYAEKRAALKKIVNSGDPVHSYQSPEAVRSSRVYDCSHPQGPALLPDSSHLHYSLP